MQAILLFPDLDFSSIQMKLSAPTTPSAEPPPNEKEIEEEVLVTDGYGGVADDPVNPQEQIGNPLIDL